MDLKTHVKAIDKLSNASGLLQGLILSLNTFPKREITTEKIVDLLEIAQYNIDGVIETLIADESEE